MRKAVRPLIGEHEDYEPLLELIGDARFVLLGEASHGTLVSGKCALISVTVRLPGRLEAS